MRYAPVLKLKDWLSSIIIMLIIPFSILLALFFIIANLDEYNSTLIILGIVLVLFLFTLRFYLDNFRILTKFAVDTYYVHFKPSNKDLILSFYSQAFILIILFIIILLFIPDLVIQSSSKDLFIFSFLMAFFLQLMTVIIITRSKIKLIDTAIEPVNNSIIQEMAKKTDDVHRINIFAFADIKPASLFLSAGVTNYAFNSKICLVSRYFQWKLSENELLAVIGHEIGHVVHRDMFKNQLILNSQAITRTLLIYFLFLNLQPLFGITVDPTFILLNLIILVAVIIIQILTSFVLRLRMYNQEILADEYGASIMGNFNLAYTLKKLPNVIPAPVDDSPFEFLGFRTAILFNRAKQLNETDESVKEFSRFSNN